MIERVPEPRRKELRTKFNAAFLREFRPNNFLNLTNAKKAKAERLTKEIIGIMIKPYLKNARQ